VKERKVRLLNREELWNYSLRTLGGRAHSSGELRQKLLRRAAEESDVAETIERLKESGYLNDSRFAESFANARLTNDQLGSARVVRDLRQRRVAPGLAEEKVREVYRDVDEEKLVEEFVRRKYRMAVREGLFAEEKDMAAAYRRLARAGFRTGAILKVLKRFAKDPDLLDGCEPPIDECEE
jgi:regulatory protein